MKREIPVGFYKQKLKVGDKIAMVATSGTSYMLVANIHSIDYEIQENCDWKTKTNYKVEVPKVKVIYEKVKQDWKWDPVSQTGEFGPAKTVKQISRVYNWTSAITLENAK
jgi:hypothetical protein